MTRGSSGLLAAFLAPALLGVPILLILLLLGGAATGHTQPLCADPTTDAAAVTGATPGAGSAGGGVRVPVVGAYVVTSAYGLRVHPILHLLRLHAGIDLATIPAGGTVVAAAAGTVTTARAEGTAGNVVTIDHGNHTTTRYLHLARILTHPGATVAAGTPIGIEGTTGLSTGEHLHFEVHINGTTTNPRDWFTRHGVNIDTGTGPAASSTAPAVSDDGDPPNGDRGANQAADSCIVTADSSQVPLPDGPNGACPPTGKPAEHGLQPVTLRAMRCTANAFPAITRFAGLGNRPGPSDHPRGLAVDFMIEHYTTPAGNAYGWNLAHWLQTHATQLHIHYLIYDQRIWNTDRAAEGWRPYTRYTRTKGNTDTQLHLDHVHLSIRSAA